MRPASSEFPQKVLLAIGNGSESATLALRAAVDLTTKAGSELHVVYAWQSFSGFHEEEAQRVLFGRLDALEEVGGAATGAHLLRGKPSEVIARLAEDLDSGLIVMGSRGIGAVRRLATGSVSEGVVGLASRPVLVVRGGSRTWPPSSVIVGDDSSESSKRAGELASAVASLLGIRTLLLRAHHVFVDAPEAARFREAAAVPPRVSLGRHELALGQRASALAQKFGRRPRVSVREGEAASVILGAAKESEGSGESALIAVGSRGLGTLDRLRLGSVSKQVLRAARGPVLIHPS